MYDPDPYRSRVAYPGDPWRPRSRSRSIISYVNWEIVAAFLILFGFFGFVLWTNQPMWRVPGTVGMVVVGWVFSLCLHEFAHAATARLGGDTSDSTASYLSFNPLKYVHPVMSILLPLIFVVLGFIALPGGAVYLRRDLVRSRGWQSAISLAGPAMNALVALAVAVPFVLGVTDTHPYLAGALAVLGFFEIAAVVLNILPVPGLDGFGALMPWLPNNVLTAIMPFYSYGPLVLFLVLWQMSGALRLYFDVVGNLMALVHIDPAWFDFGFSSFNILHF